MIKKYEFYVSTNYVGSDVTEIIEIELEDDATEEEIDKEVQGYYEEWLNQNTEQSFYEVE